MASDLPFDGEDEVAERGGDAAYRIASATARVARGGAYVTGGALIATNGGGVPAPPGELDSRNTGWAHNVDPDPDVPSPVVTFPDPEPVAPQDMPFGSPGDASVTMPLPHGTLDIQVNFPDFDELDSYGAPYMDQVPGLELLPGGPDGENPAAGFAPGTPGTGVPESNMPGLPDFGPPDAPGGIPGLDDFPGLGGEFPGLGGDFPVPGGEGPGAPGAFELPSPGDAFKTDIFDLPGFGLNQDGPVQPVAQTLGAGPADRDAGSTELPGTARTFAGDSGSGGDDAWFEFTLDADGGALGGLVLGDFSGSVQVESSMNLDISVGPGGARVDSDWDFGISAEDAFSLDEQLDQYTGWIQAGAGNPAAGGGQPGVADDGRSADTAAAGPRDDAVSAMGGTGAVSAPNGVTPAGVAGPATSGISAVPGAAPTPAGAAVPMPGAAAPMPNVAVPAPSVPGPMAVAPVTPPAPVAAVPMVAGPVPPPVAPAAVAPAVQPVAATPLQTTVQPDVATSPVAHVFQAPAGPSPLTAPAAQLPDLFHRLPQPAPVEPPTEPTLPDGPTAVLPTTTAPVTTSDTVSTTPTTLPDGSTTTGGSTTTSVDSSVTLLPGGSTTTPDGSTTTPQDGSTSPDVSTTTSELTETGGTTPTSSGEPGTGTEYPSTTGESGGVTTTAPGSSTDSGTTTGPIGGGSDVTDPTSGTTPSTADLPTQQLPTAEPQVPSVSVPSQQPSTPDAQLPMPQPMPTPLPAQPVAPIAEHSVAVVPYDMHGAGTVYPDHPMPGLAGGELTGDLSAALLPHTVTVAGDPVADPGFWVYF